MTKREEWRCAGCGKESPNRIRSCDCPTGCVVKPGGVGAWKLDLADTPDFAGSLRGFAAMCERSISAEDGPMLAEKFRKAANHIEAQAALLKAREVSHEA